MARVRGQSIVEVAAPIATCWSLLVDAASYPQWYDTLDEVVVEGRDDTGRADLVLVRARVGAPLGWVEFRLALAYREPILVEGHQVGTGSFVKDVASEWQLQPIDERRTRVTYTMSIASDGARAAAGFRAAAGLVRRDLIAGFTHALMVRAEQVT